MPSPPRGGAVTWPLSQPWTSVVPTMTTCTGSLCGVVAVAQEIVIRRERTQNRGFTSGIIRVILGRQAWETGEAPVLHGNAIDALSASRLCSRHHPLRVHPVRH